MSERLHPNVLKLREAHVPVYTYNTSLRVEGDTFLAEEIRQCRFSAGASLNSYYLHAYDNSKQAMRRVVLLSALMAKELRLKEQKVTYVTLAGLLREIRFTEMEREQQRFNPVIDRIGKGYIVIGDFLEFNDVTDKYGYHAVQLAADYLLTHVTSGGALVLGAGHTALRDAHMFGAEFATLLNDRFIPHQVQPGAQ